MITNLWISLGLISIFTSQVIADGAFAGCWNVAPTNAVLKGTSGYTVATCLSACQSTKATDSSVYSVHQVSTGSCWCTANWPDFPYTAIVQGNNNRCASDERYSYRILSTTFQNQGSRSCYDSVTLMNPTSDKSTGGMSLLGCYYACRGFKAVNYYMQSSTLTSCICGDGIASLGSITFCYRFNDPNFAGGYFVYNHPAYAAVSGLTRRSRTIPPTLGGGSSPEYCPDKMTACRVQGHPDAYECIDTSSELESCGGCMHGQFGSTNSTSTQGTDCTALRGRSTKTCRRGHCVSL